MNRLAVLARHLFADLDTKIYFSQGDGREEPFCSREFRCFNALLLHTGSGSGSKRLIL